MFYFYWMLVAFQFLATVKEHVLGDVLFLLDASGVPIPGGNKIISYAVSYSTVGDWGKHTSGGLSFLTSGCWP